MAFCHCVTFIWQSPEQRSSSFKETQLFCLSCLQITSSLCVFIISGTGIPAENTHLAPRCFSKCFVFVGEQLKSFLKIMPRHSTQAQDITFHTKKRTTTKNSMMKINTAQPQPYIQIITSTSWKNRFSSESENGQVATITCLHFVVRSHFKQSLYV